MASITIRNLEDDIKQRLRVRAAEHGRSMEEEARDILRRVMGDAASPRNLAAAIRARVARACLKPRYFKTARGISGLHLNAYYRKADLDRLLRKAS